MAQPVSDDDIRAFLDVVRRWMAERTSKARPRKASGGGTKGGMPAEMSVAPAVNVQQQAPQMPSQPSAPQVSSPTEGIADFRTSQGLAPVSLPSSGLGSGIDPAMMEAARAQMAQPVADVTRRSAAPQDGMSANGQFYINGNPVDPGIAMMLGLVGGMSGGGINRAITWEGSGAPPSMRSLMTGQPDVIRPFAKNGGGINSETTALRIAKQRLR